jgi:hypothetical protein
MICDSPFMALPPLRYLASAYDAFTIPETVIPGSPEGRGPESMNTDLWKMASGLAAAPRPGMTTWTSVRAVHCQQVAIF